MAVSQMVKGDYGDNERCEILVRKPGTLRSILFDVEEMSLGLPWDSIAVTSGDGSQQLFTGNDSINVAVEANAKINWTSDSSVRRQGWTICLLTQHVTQHFHTASVAECLEFAAGNKVDVCRTPRLERADCGLNEESFLVFNDSHTAVDTRPPSRFVPQPAAVDHRTASNRDVFPARRCQGIASSRRRIWTLATASAATTTPASACRPRRLSVLNLTTCLRASATARLGLKTCTGGLRCAAGARRDAGCLIPK